MTAPSNHLQTQHCQRGFSLIEVLIAFVVLTIGVLGIASLLIMSKNSLHQSNQRTMAVNLADAMVERIKINPTAITDYDTDGKPLGGGEVSEPHQDCTTIHCNPEQLAAFDLWTWEQALDGANVEIEGVNVGGLIEPQACITFNADDGKVRSGRLNVTIAWKGLAKISDAVEAGETTCGGAAAGKDPYRRQVTVNSVVMDESEF